MDFCFSPAGMWTEADFSSACEYKKSAFNIHISTVWTHSLSTAFPRQPLQSDMLSQTNRMLDIMTLASDPASCWTTKHSVRACVHVSSDLETGHSLWRWMLLKCIDFDDTIYFILCYTYCKPLCLCCFQRSVVLLQE